MSKVRDTAQAAMDTFYNQYRTATDFWDNSFFERECVMVRNDMLNTEFVTSKKGDIDDQQEISSSLIEYFDADVTKVEGTDEYEAKIPVPIFVFQYDRFQYGLQYISPNKISCGELRRIRRAEAWAACKSPIKNVVYWWVDSNKVKFINVQAGCLKKVTMALIPSLDAANICDSIIPDGIESKVKDIVVAKAFDAWMRRNGKMDMTNDGNGNTAGSGKEAGDVLKNQRTE